jgi:hypothetical protein
LSLGQSPHESFLAKRGFSFFDFKACNAADNVGDE